MSTLATSPELDPQLLRTRAGLSLGTVVQHERFQTIQPLMAGKKKVQRFGGRATATGVGYEARVAARLAVKLLRGRKALVWPGVHGGNLEAITLQSANAVDDVVIDIAGVKNLERVHLSAKDRADTIALTAGSAAFADTIRDFVAQYLARSRKGVRLGWAVPTSAGKNATRHLL